VVGERTIEVRELTKSFRVRVRRDDGRPGSLSTRAKPYRFKKLEVLKGISFEVGRGEIFGVVGRNGSGKSTLLKILASVYRAGGGEVKVAGRIGPFLELGVGFHPQLTAWDNVRMNAVMMGLSPQEASDRFKAIIEFAELEQFTGMELKNYSSGMKTRLAFSVLVEIGADVFLIDEVLSAGDAKFQQKCVAKFDRLREEGRTILLVSHALPNIRRLCDRAMLLHQGEIDRIGDPEEVTARYLEVNAAERTRRAPRQERPIDAKEGPSAEIIEAWVQDGNGNVASRIPVTEKLAVHAMLEVRRKVRQPSFSCEIHDEYGAVLHSVPARPLGGKQGRILPGDRVHVHAQLTESLPPGTYVATCRVLRTDQGDRKFAVSESRLVQFTISRGGRSRSPQATFETDPTSETVAEL
jgi:ABC-2 type transport system ATP-binding protein